MLLVLQDQILSIINHAFKRGQILFDLIQYQPTNHTYAHTYVRTVETHAQNNNSCQVITRIFYVLSAKTVRMISAWKSKRSKNTLETPYTKTIWSHTQKLTAQFLGIYFLNGLKSNKGLTGLCLKRFDSNDLSVFVVILHQKASVHDPKVPWKITNSSRVIMQDRLEGYWSRSTKLTFSDLLEHLQLISLDKQVVFIQSLTIFFREQQWLSVRCAVVGDILLSCRACVTISSCISISLFRQYPQLFPWKTSKCHRQRPPSLHKAFQKCIQKWSPSDL